MSSLQFPILPGLAWNVQKGPIFSTKIQQSVNMREMRAAYSSSPVWFFTLQFEFIRDDGDYRELDQLIGLFLQCLGSWDNFLYTDPSDCIVAGQQIGVGDGTTTTFLMTRAKGGFVEPVQDLTALSFGPAMWAWLVTFLMWSSDSTTLMWSTVPDLGAFTNNGNGYVTFATPPPLGVPVLMDAEFQFRCRFCDSSGKSAGDTGADHLYNEFMSNLWEIKQVSFIGSLSGKI